LLETLVAFRFPGEPMQAATNAPPAPSAWPRDLLTAALKQFTDEIMCHIAALLPENYRGVYADHPRLNLLSVFQNLQNIFLIPR